MPDPMRKTSRLGWNINIIIMNVSKHMKALFLDPYFQYCKYSNSSKLFVYLYKWCLRSNLGSTLENFFLSNNQRNNRPLVKCA